MDRTEIHQQIRELSDKINHLNENLLNSRKIHPIEIDLIKLYVRELMATTDQLAILTGITQITETKQRPVADMPTETARAVTDSQTIAPVNNDDPLPTKLNSGFSISLADETTDEEELTEKALPEEEPEPAHEIEFIDEPNPTPPPRRQVTIQQPVQKQQPIQAEPVNFKNSEPASPVKEHTKPSISLSMEEEHKDAPSINDLFAQQDKSDHYNKAKRADIKGVKESMDLGERFLFLKELFNSDQSAFDRATEYLSNVATFEEAKIFVEESLRTHFNWAGKDGVVKQFYTLLEQRFRN